MLSLDIRVTGDRRTIMALDSWARELEDWTPVWELVEPDVYAMADEQWSSKGSRGGDSWPELSPRYAAWKARRYPGQPLMVMTGELREAMTKRGATGQVRIIDRGRMEIGTDLVHAATHQFGRGDIPQRQFLAVTDRDIDRWRAFAEQRAREAAGRAGLA